jgi:phosphoribosylanthranilate isomerase
VKSTDIKVKICGITNDDDADFAVELGAYALGFVYDRKVTPSIVADRDVVRRVSERFGKQIEIVAVFADNDLSDIKQAVDEDGISMIQLSGSETPDFTAQVVREMGLPVIKAIHVKDKEDIRKAQEYTNVLHLFDTKVSGMAGGTGKTFDWEILRDYTDPFVLAGGLNPRNIRKAIRVTGARMVDLSSGVSSHDRARKDRDLTQEFFRALPKNC